jgi:hypothetical protein
MKLQFAILLALFGATLVSAFKPGSNFCDDEKEKFDTCKPLVNEEGGKSGSSHSSSSSKSKGGSSEAEGCKDGWCEGEGKLSNITYVGVSI